MRSASILTKRARSATVWQAARTRSVIGISIARAPTVLEEGLGERSLPPSPLPVLSWNHLYTINHRLGDRGGEIEIELAIGNRHIHRLNQGNMGPASLGEHIDFSDWSA